jgi:hypothetical protein
MKWADEVSSYEPLLQYILWYDRESRKVKTHS